MRSDIPPPRSRGNDRKSQSTRAPMPPSRNVFNCIVDDSALLAAARKSTRDGIRKWVVKNAIRVFVPLYTLEQLDCLKQGARRINGDAREVIAWLDDITSLPDMEVSGQVQLQGVDENYASWDEVESFLLPATLLSTESELYDVGDLHEDVEQSLQIDDSSDRASSHSVTSFVDQEPRTPSSKRSSCFSQNSPDTVDTHSFTTLEGSVAHHSASGYNSKGHSRNSSTLSSTSAGNQGAAIPYGLRPLFSYILWRVNQDHGHAAGLDSFIFLTNDPVKRAFAQRFGLRVKNTDQLREAIRREDRDDKNRQALFQKESVESPSRTKVPSEDGEISKRPARSPTMNKSQQLWEPNPSPNRGQSSQPSPRGRGGRGRGGRGGSRGGFHAPHAPRNMNQPQDANGLAAPMDPNSFSRPSVSRNLRGDRKKLWNPALPT